MSWKNFFSRVNKVAEAKANSAVDTMELSPEMIDQSLRDMREKIQHALEAQAQVKAAVIQYRSDAATHKGKAADYEQKANSLLDRVGVNGFTQEEADTLSSQALIEQQKEVEKEKSATLKADKIQERVDALSKEIGEMNDTLKEAEDNALELKARDKAADAMSKVNKELSSVGGDNNAKALFDRMQKKIQDKEAIAEAYGQLDNPTKGIDDKINDALKQTASASASDALAALKKKREAAATTAKN